MQIGVKNSLILVKPVCQIKYRIIEDMKILLTDCGGGRFSSEDEDCFSNLTSSGNDSFGNLRSNIFFALEIFSGVPVNIPILTSP